MNHLIYDVETTGLPIDYKAHVHEVDNWPRLVQLAWLIIDDHFKTLTYRNHIIKPDGFVIPDDVAEIHGVTNDIAETDGIDAIVALNEIAIAQELCQIQVGHNINFDRKVIGAEFIRNGMEDHYLYAKDCLPKICTMFKTTKLCGLKNGNRPKWPKLQELHTQLFGKEFDGAHDAMADVMATSRCYQELIKTEHLDPEKIANDYASASYYGAS